MPKCTECRYCIEQDYGHSNYTAEGTEVDCLLGFNPYFPEDKFYGKDKSLSFADRCQRFSRGESVSVDTEQEDGDLDRYSDDEEIKVLLRRYEARDE